MDDLDEAEWEQLSARVLEAALRELADGPLPLAELTERLIADGVVPDPDDAQWDIEGLVDEILLDTDDTWMTTDRIVAATRHLFDDVVLTHRVTGDELARGVLDACPDLLMLTWAERDGLPLTGGGAVSIEYPFDGEPHLADEGSVVGPEGWLDDVASGELVGLRRRGSEITLLRRVEPVEPEPVADLLAATFEAIRRPGVAIESDELVMEMLVADPGVFRTPTIPLDELLTLAGLQREGAWVDLIGTEITPPGASWREQRIRKIASRHQMEWCCREAFERVLETWSSHVLSRSDGPAPLPDGLADDLTHGGVAPALVDWVLDEHTPTSQRLGSFADRLVEAGRSLAGIGWFLHGENQLGAGQASAALASFETAVRVDGYESPAVFPLAHLYADAGEPTKSLATWRHATGTVGHEPMIESLTQLLRPYTSARRNELCPCGSGRKFKQCCASSPKLSTPDRRRLAKRQATLFASRHLRDDVFGLALTAAEASGVRLGDIDGFRDALRRWHQDEFVQDVVLFEGGALEEYLVSRGDLIPEAERDWLDALVERPRTLWELTRIDDRYDARDVMTGETIEGVVLGIYEGGLDDHVFVLGRFAADNTDGHPGFVGALAVVPAISRDRVVELVDRDPTDHELVQWYASRFAPPRLTNRDGDELLVGSARFAPIGGGDWATTEQALDDLYGDREDGEDGRWSSVVHLDGGDNIVMAFLHREDDELVVQVNSANRLGRVRDELEAAGLTFLGADMHDVEELRRRYGSDAEDDEFDDDGFPEDRDDGFAEDGDEPDLPAEVLDQVQDQMEDRWIADHIPAFGGLTPPQALADPTRRQDVIDLLAEMERRVPVGFAPYDMARLRRKLSLGD